jgi:hypothetical protein
MEKSIHIRKSHKYQDVFNMLETVAPDFRNEITTTILEMARLGVIAYTSKEHTTETTTMNVRREVCRSIFPDLAGTLMELRRHEMVKAKPKQALIDFYQLAAKALFARHANFRHLNDNDVEIVFKTIAPILKTCNQSKTKLAMEKSIQKNKSVLLDLIKQTQVSI